ncbi:MAG TPA: Tol-Pal system beta propeller repeat protein TolB [Gammaproteobacteria bacterium]|nr:Tol-Pal system beta propeller repeat protein TolB [Gammaproteobacteria bacterium]
MRKYLSSLVFVWALTHAFSAYALLSMELTQGVAGATPIAVVPFAGADNAPQPVSTIIASDLQNSGRFKVFGQSALKQFPSNPKAVAPDYFRGLGTDNVVIGTVQPVGPDQYQVNFSLMDMYKGSGQAGVVLSKQYTVSGSALRQLSHHISDLVFEQLTGVRGVFSTRIAYVVVQHASNNNPARYVLEVADQDGYAPRPLLSSPEPIMSPAWSPNGRQLAYVSFENRRASIYEQEVATGARRLVSSYAGINGAPAWSPDGSKLALVLSKSGSPNIYVMSADGGGLKQITNDFYINTEPSWSPDGRSLIFTSNRSGGPQIYQVPASGGNPSRVTFDGDYNARASFTPDGNHIAFIHRVSGVYKIAILDLDTGTVKVLTSQMGDSASPSVAPNGSMLLYDTVYGGRNVLGMVSADARVQLILPARNGDAQDPAWSPFSA